MPTTNGGFSPCPSISNGRYATNSKFGRYFRPDYQYQDLDCSNISGTNGVVDGQIQSQNPGSLCPHCGKYFLCVKMHVVRAHPDIYRNSSAHKHKTSRGQNKNSDTSQNLTEQRSKSNTSDLELWNQKFSSLLMGERDIDKFETLVNEFTTFLKNAIPLCKGPELPAVKYFKPRQQWKINNTQSNFSNSKNPQRSDKRMRESRRNQYPL